MPNQWQWFAIAGVCSILSIQPVLADEGTSQIKGAEEILLKPSSHISPLDEQKKPCTARVVQSAECKLILGTKAQPDEAIRRIRQLSEIERSFTSAELLVQAPTPSSPSINNVIEVTGVKANPTDKGVEVILQTTLGEQLPVVNRSAGNSYIADIPNAQLRLSNGEAFVFRSEKPITGITEITVTNFDANTIRVTVTGEAGVPTVELFDSPEEGLVFGVASVVASTPPQQQPQNQPTPEIVEPGSETEPDAPAAEGEEEIEIVVTGEQETGYRVPNSSTVTRTDTPLRDIPQSIQIIPQEVLRDQRADIPSALINAPSVRTSSPTNFDSVRIQVRGFFSTSTLNGFKDSLSSNLGPDLTGIDRIEVLQGPNSILFGSLSPGGTVNFVTKQPLPNPY